MTTIIDFLAPDDDENDRRILAALRSRWGPLSRDVPLRDEHLIGQTYLRSKTTAGIVDIIRGGLSPLDYDTVEERAQDADYGGVTFKVAGLASIGGFKRLANRPRDRNDLEGLAEIHGKLPIEPIPGLDS